MSKVDEAQLLERLVQEVLASSKYRDISPEFILSIGKQELAKRRHFKEALKATKNKLHQVSGVYVEKHSDEENWLISLQSALLNDDQEKVQSLCRGRMEHHTSTRERLPILEQFYDTLFAALPPVSSVIDIACGLHPLAIPWMKLPVGSRYYAYDVQGSLINFLARYMSLLPLQGTAQARDVLQHCPDEIVDVAFVLKTLPCLEQVEKQAGLRLLHGLNARNIIVSFPIASLGGYRKGMASFYETSFSNLLAQTTWEVQRLEFATELVFLVKK